MSLIHDALKQLDSPGTPDPTRGATHTMASALPPVAGRRSGFAVAISALVAVMVAGGVGYAGWKSTNNSASAIAVADARVSADVLPVAAPLLPIPTATPTATPTPVSVLAAPSTSFPDVVVATVAEAVAPIASAPKAPSMATVASTKPASARRLPVEAKATKVVERAAMAAPRATIAADQVSPEQRFSLFLEAVRNKDTANAKSQLVGLRRQLTRSSISLLRAEAWFAFLSGDTVTARREYREVIERLPGDEEASINLASVEAAQSQPEAARQILADALRANPDSEALKSALSSFGGRR